MKEAWRINYQILNCYIGSLIAYVETNEIQIEHCQNTSVIQAQSVYNSFIGGFFSFIDDYVKSVLIKNCLNNSYIKCELTLCNAGGFIGYQID